MIDQINELAINVKARFPNARVDKRTFESGAAVLDVVIDAYLIVLEFSPKEGFGISWGKDLEELYDPKHCQTFQRNEFNIASNFLFEICEDIGKRTEKDV